MIVLVTLLLVVVEYRRVVRVSEWYHPAGAATWVSGRTSERTVTSSGR